MNILIVDDDEFTMELIKRKLQIWGYSNIMTLDNGKDAFSYLSNRDKSYLVLMDWVLPGKNGNEVFQELPETEKNKLYKILLTAKNTTEDMHFGLSCGAHHYLTKPIEFSELKRCLEEGEKFLGETAK